jgi:hypothetical protein
MHLFSITTPDKLYTAILLSVLLVNVKIKESIGRYFMTSTVYGFQTSIMNGMKKSQLGHRRRI